MAKTEKLSYHNAEKYAYTLWSESEKETDSRLRLSNRMFGLVLMLGLESGARISDLLEMKYSDIKEMKDRPNVFALNYYVKKSKAYHKWVISAQLKGRIDITREWLKLEYGYYGVMGWNTDYIFFNPKANKPFTREWASKRISVANKLGKMGEIVDVAGSHSLRKAAAHNLFDRSQDLRLVQSLLKHKNIATTSKYLGLEEEEALSKAIHVLGY